MEAVPGKVDEGRDTALAKRLARAMGTEIVRRVGGFGLDGFPDVGWEDDEEILRGGLGAAGLLDLGKVWECDGLSLPAGAGTELGLLDRFSAGEQDYDPASPDVPRWLRAGTPAEEIDLRLAAAGFQGMADFQGMAEPTVQEKDAVMARWREFAGIAGAGRAFPSAASMELCFGIAADGQPRSWEELDLMLAAKGFQRKGSWEWRRMRGS